MGSQIKSWLKKAKSQKSQYLSHENLDFESPGPPKTGPKRVQNGVPNLIFDAEALEKPLESLLERSWRLLEPKKDPLNGSWPFQEKL